MPVKVTFSVVLRDTWGAMDAFKEGGGKAVMELIEEDKIAFLDEPGGEFTIAAFPDDNP